MQAHRLQPAATTVALVSALTFTALLTACGGGGSPAPAVPEQTVITGRAVDGPLAGATACYDLNDNGSCDAAEPRSNPTAADGSFSLAVAPAEAGRHAVVVDVPASAIDADTGTTVGTPFTLRAPATSTAAGHAVFVSPLTTLVHAHMLASGQTLDEARQLVQQQAGTGYSPLADFTQDTSDAARQTARLARLVQLTAQEQHAQLAAVAGTAAGDGSNVSADDVEREVQASLVAGLPTLAGALTDPMWVNASGGALQTLLASTARQLAPQLAQQTDLTAASVRLASTMRRLSEPPAPATPVATAVLRTLRYTDANRWMFRMHQASAADNAVDANGYARFYDWTLESTLNPTTGRAVVLGAVQTPSTTVATHWNGSAWVMRAANGRYLARVRDSQGRSDYNFGDSFEIGSGIRRVEDISGQSLQEVVRAKIRRFPGSSNGVAFANWGPSDLTRYGTATFPSGSYLIYQTNTTSSSAINYPNLSSNQVQGYSAAVSAGGDSRSTSGLACADSQQNTATTPVATLEAMVALFKGTPCIFNQSGTAPNQSLPVDEVWGFSTLSVGVLANTNTLPANTGNFYTTAAHVRVSFAASGNRATFWRCYSRTSNNSPRNCSVLGLATWSIQPLGDARVLSFSVAPALAQRLNFARHFVERGGRVYYGGKSPVGATTTDLRLNLTAANAVFHQLGLPRAKPISEPGTATGARAATLSTIQGTWGGATLTEANVWRFGPNGRFFMAEARPYLAATQEQSGAELGWIDYDPTGGYFSTLLEVDSNLNAGTSHPDPGEMFLPITVTPTAISGGTGSNSFVLNRLETSRAATSLVGMWGYGSATDLSVPHLVFFSNGRLMIITHNGDPQCPATNQCPPGVEFSEYSYNLTTGTMTAFNLLYDTNGCDGAFETCAAGRNNTTHQVNIVMAADGLTAVLTNGQGQASTLYRIQAQ